MEIALPKSQHTFVILSLLDCSFRETVSKTFSCTDKIWEKFSGHCTCDCFFYNVKNNCSILQSNNKSLLMNQQDVRWYFTFHHILIPLVSWPKFSFKCSRTKFFFLQPVISTIWKQLLQKQRTCTRYGCYKTLYAQKNNRNIKSFSDSWRFHHPNRLFKLTSENLS